MYALKMLGLAVLAGACILAFIVGYDQLRGLSASKKAREEAQELNIAIVHVISTGSPQDSLDIEIPEGYTLKFESRQMMIDGYKYPKSPQDEYSLPVNGPTLNTGHYNLMVSLENGVVNVSEV